MGFYGRRDPCAVLAGLQAKLAALRAKRMALHAAKAPAADTLAIAAEITAVAAAVAAAMAACNPVNPFDCLSRLLKRYGAGAKITVSEPDASGGRTYTAVAGGHTYRGNCAAVDADGVDPDVAVTAPVLSLPQSADIVQPTPVVFKQRAALPETPPIVFTAPAKPVVSTLPNALDVLQQLQFEAVPMVPAPKGGGYTGVVPPRGSTLGQASPLAVYGPLDILRLTGGK